MTMPDERTRTLIQVRDFLLAIEAGTEAPNLTDGMRREATRLLRHFPLDWELCAMARDCPSLWANPRQIYRQLGRTMPEDFDFAAALKTLRQAMSAKTPLRRSSAASAPATPSPAPGRAKPLKPK